MRGDGYYYMVSNFSYLCFPSFLSGFSEPRSKEREKRRVRERRGWEERKREREWAFKFTDVEIASGRVRALVESHRMVSGVRLRVSGFQTGVAPRPSPVPILPLVGCAAPPHQPYPLPNPSFTFAHSPARPDTDPHSLPHRPFSYPHWAWPQSTHTHQKAAASLLEEKYFRFESAAPKKSLKTHLATSGSFCSQLSLGTEGGARIVLATTGGWGCRRWKYRSLHPLTPTPFPRANSGPG